MQRLPLNLFHCAARSSALVLVVNLELKARLTDWFKFDTRYSCMEEEDDKGNHLASIPLQCIAMVGFMLI